MKLYEEKIMHQLTHLKYKNTHRESKHFQIEYKFRSVDKTSSFLGKLEENGNFITQTTENTSSNFRTNTKQSHQKL